MSPPKIDRWINDDIAKGEMRYLAEYVLSKPKAKIALGFKADTEPSQIIAVIQEKIKTNKNKASSNCNPLFIKSSYSTF